MPTPDSFSPTRPRWPFSNRPWVTGKLYDDMARLSILHCDAYVIERGAHSYLIIDWREGGKIRIALDAYLIEADGLTPAWDNGMTGRPVYWHKANAAIMARVHQTVLLCAARAAATGGLRTMGGKQWARVMVQAHYVMVRESDTEIAGNRYATRTKSLTDIL